MSDPSYAPPHVPHVYKNEAIVTPLPWHRSNTMTYFGDALYRLCAGALWSPRRRLDVLVIVVVRLTPVYGFEDVLRPDPALHGTVLVHVNLRTLHLVDQAP